VSLISPKNKKKKDPYGKRFFIMDNYYNRNFLAKQTKIFSDGEIRIFGTIKFLNTDERNKATVETAKAEIKDAKRSSWRLAQVFNEYENIAQNAGYIVFEDRAIVVLYTNDLASTPIELIHSLNDTSIECVKGLALLDQWIKNESMHRTVLIVLLQLLFIISS